MLACWLLVQSNLFLPLVFGPQKHPKDGCVVSDMPWVCPSHPATVPPAPPPVPPPPASRTNLQILQRNVLVRFKSMTQPGAPGARGQTARDGDGWDWAPGVEKGRGWDEKGFLGLKPGQLVN